MFGSKSRLIKKLDAEIEDLKMNGYKAADKFVAKIREESDRILQENRDLQYKCDILTSLLKQIRINVTLPARQR
jgi:hypothetical protein